MRLYTLSWLKSKLIHSKAIIKVNENTQRVLNVLNNALQNFKRSLFETT